MGLLRICLALAVVSTHTHQRLFPFDMITAYFAVKTFFVISGFYMALILNEKYLTKANSYKLFITNRILRLYPLYLTVFSVSLILYMLCVTFPSCSLDPGQYTIVQFNPYTYLLHTLNEILHSWGILIYGLISNLIYFVG